MTIGSGLKIAIDVINKHLAKGAIKSLHPNLEKIIDSTKVVPIAPNEDQEHREWLLKRRWEKGRHIEFDTDIDIRDWTDDDMRSAMMRKDYPNNPALKKQVAAYFKKKYPGTMKYG